MFDPSQFDFLSQQVLGQPHKFGPGVDPEGDWTRWNCIYPNYINSKKKVSEGRRIAEAKAVENPTVEEIGMICEHLSLPYVVEFRKAYPRDWLVPGRVKVQMKNESGKWMNPTVTTKNVLMLKMGELIPQLKLRHVPVSSASSSTRPAGAAPAKGKKKKKH